MIDHESEIRLTMCNQQENDQIVDRYTKSMSVGSYKWLMNGNKGSLFDSIKNQLQNDGIIK